MKSKLIKSLLVLGIFLFLLVSISTLSVAYADNNKCCDADSHQEGIYCVKDNGTNKNAPPLYICPNVTDVCTQTSPKTFECKAQSPIDEVFGVLNVPKQVRSIGFGAGGISNFLTTIIQLIYVVASIIFIFMIIISALQWIMSGGDKEKVASARNRLTWAIIGITLLALSFLIIGVVGQITGFKFFEGQPTGPQPCSPAEINDCNLAGKTCVPNGTTYRCV